MLQACKAVDSVLSVITWASGDEGTLVRAVKDAGVKRFIPSVFGVDFAVAAPGSCLVFDNWSATHQSVKAASIPYMLVHCNGFFTYWVDTLGDLTRLGGKLPPAEVNVYDDGNVKGAFVSEPDIASVTVRALNDPKMQEKEVRITQNMMTQNEIIDLWQEMSGRPVKKVFVPASDVERLIASFTAPDQRGMLAATQLHRAFWLRGEASNTPPTRWRPPSCIPTSRSRPSRRGWRSCFLIMRPPYSQIHPKGSTMYKMKREKIYVVTGATGAVGKGVGERLKAQGHQVMSKQ